MLFIFALIDKFVCLFIIVNIMKWNDIIKYIYHHIPFTWFV